MEAHLKKGRSLWPLGGCGGCQESFTSLHLGTHSTHYDRKLDAFEVVHSNLGSHWVNPTCWNMKPTSSFLSSMVRLKAFPSPQPHMLKGDHGPEKAQPDNSCARLLRLDIPLGAFKQIGGLLNSAICSNEYSCLWAGQHQPKLLSCIKRLPLSLAHYALSMSKTNQVQHAQKSLWRISAVTV